MNDVRMKLNENGRVVIPAALRAALCVAEVEFSDDQGRTYAIAALRSEQLIRLHHRPCEQEA